MILLWGLPQDTPLAWVHLALEELGIPVVFLDQRTVLDCDIDVSFGLDLHGYLRVHQHTYDLDSVTAAYLRPYDIRQLRRVSQAGAGSNEWRHAFEFEEILWSWAELTPARVVNRPAAMANNGSKPRQASGFAAFGFQVPPTLITTDRDAVLEFERCHGALIYKSISSVRSVVTRLCGPDLSRLGDLAWCPTQFQQYIPGNDYRVHVVGEEVYCCELASDADDYRYSAATMKTAVQLDSTWAERCKQLTRAQGLEFAGIDLRRAPDDGFYCFEVNPSPAFTFFEEPERPIAAAVARLLSTAHF